MANSKGPSSIRSMMYNGKNTSLPPKIPFPGISPTYTEYVPTSAIGPKTLPKSRDGSSNHQRISSESFLMEEQPCWLDELLNEPETPMRRGGHRRSSSDSFAYYDKTNAGSMNYFTHDDDKVKNIPMSSWASQDSDFYKGMQHGSIYADSISLGKTKNLWWDSLGSSTVPPCGLPSPRDKIIVPNSGPLTTLNDAEWNSSFFSGKRDPAESVPQDPKGSSEKVDVSHVKSSALETDTIRAKQHFAQRSRVRKLQYIAELERNVQSLQVEGSEVSAELEFLNQQNLILSMENKALKQRLENLAQEQVIKYMEHEVLEREVKRLRNLYQQHQQQQPQKPSSHRRANSRDLDQQFASLTLKYKEPSSGCDSLSG